MPVTFGTVQLLPAPASPPPSGGGQATPANAAQPQPPDARDLGPVLRHLHDRAARVRAH